MKMPTYLRKLYIAKHNERIGEENERFRREMKKNRKR